MRGCQCRSAATRGTGGGRRRWWGRRRWGGGAPLVWTSRLVGAIPRQGKTFATRLPAAGLILDPFTRLYVFDGKGGKDWKAVEVVAHRFVCGDEIAQVEAVRDALIGLVGQTQARFARMAALDDEVCP